ncbi:MAG TPA: ThaI family type II restriction endonuclease [Anaerolineales bacterium]|nr:ThaI family type II restriction endonuclease [Anaerolineales bacterium]
MASRLKELFADRALVAKIQRRLPILFSYAEQESSRGGHVGVEAETVRIQVLVALLIHKFGEENVQRDAGRAPGETNVRLFDAPISIKTTTSAALGSVKLLWTADTRKANEAAQTYSPSSDYLLGQVNWGGEGGLFYIPLEAQDDVLRAMGRENYLRLPKAGMQPRGVELSREALTALVAKKAARRLLIRWERPAKDDPYQRWVDYWRQEA